MHNFVLDFRRLVKDVRDAARKAASKAPGFASGNGAIRICFTPHHWLADESLRGFGDMREDVPGDYDGADCEYVFRIKAGGSYLVPHDDGVTDCSAIAAAKIAHCRLAKSRAQDASCSGQETPKLNSPAIDYDLVPFRGVVGFRVNARMPDLPILRGYKIVTVPYCDIYVCVCGASEDDDQVCVTAAGQKVINFFWNERTYFECFAAVTC